jgi:phospholipid/cholesterol/gamma-HCH transport system substrate-binding protein
MKTSHLEILVGLFAVAALAAIGWLTLKVGTGSMPAGATYLIDARFANAGGLHAGSSVQLAGVTVGRVEGVRMDPEDYSAIATLRLLEELRLPTDSMASIKTSGLIGDKFVSLSPGADETWLAPGGLITMTESAVDLESLIGKVAFGEVDNGGAPSEELEQQDP